MEIPITEHRFHPGLVDVTFYPAGQDDSLKNKAKAKFFASFLLRYAPGSFMDELKACIEGFYSGKKGLVEMENEGCVILQKLEESR